MMTQEKKIGLKLVESWQLPMKNASGEEMHALKSVDHPGIIAVSSDAYKAWKSYKDQVNEGKREVTLSDGDVWLLNKVFDQIGVPQI